MDIIIDDGYHNFEANRCFLENSIHQLNENGIFIIEDIQNNEKHLFIKKIKEWNNIFPNYIFDLIEIPSLRNKQDNNIIYVSPKKNKM